MVRKMIKRVGPTEVFAENFDYYHKKGKTKKLHKN